MVVLLFLNQVEQFLKQLNESIENGISNSSQLSQQSTNVSQSFVNINNVDQNSSVTTISNQTNVGGGGIGASGRYFIR